jgi:hypothetical protein
MRFVEWGRGINVDGCSTEPTPASSAHTCEHTVDEAADGGHPASLAGTPCTVIVQNDGPCVTRTRHYSTERGSFDDVLYANTLRV